MQFYLVLVRGRRVGMVFALIQQSDNARIKKGKKMRRQFTNRNGACVGFRDGDNYYNKWGGYIGRRDRNGYYYNSHCECLGKVREGRYYNKWGGYEGRYKDGRFYNKWGGCEGRSDSYGRHYNRNGGYEGRAHGDNGGGAFGIFRRFFSW